MIPLALAIATRLSGSLVGGAAAGLLTAASPELISYASTVGVDTIMSFFCLLTVWLGLRVFERKTYGDIILCALAAGFAISTKYNAAPVAIVPITALWLAGVRDRRKLVASLLLPVAAFLLGSPYILISFSLFLKELSYEIWHYAIAGHEENTGSPGLGQAVHYITWIIRSALGLGALLCCVAGIWIAAKSADVRRWIVGIFPLLFFILMIAQKVNFTRNMLVIIPFVAIYAGVAIAKFSKRTNQTIAALAIILILSQPLLLSLRYRRSILNIQESRLAAAEWIESQAAAGEKIAWDGELQLIPSVLKLNNVDRVDLDQVKLNELAKNGYNHLLVAPQHFADWANNSERVFPGIAEPQRIVSNPEIRVVKLSKVP